jgi:uncharacterized protein GlcG (DUF336 family)
LYVLVQYAILATIPRQVLLRNYWETLFCKYASSQKGATCVNLSIDIARKILEASKQRARELRSPVSIAIVDAGGHIVLFERMMSPYGWATGNISIAKACTAVMFNQSTDAVAQWGAGIPGFASSMAEMSHGKFIMAAGGWPIRISGATIGGIGVSGGNAPGRDDEIAKAGLGALEAAAPPIPAHPMQPAVPAQQQQHSRPYMQPSSLYPPMPASENPPAPVSPAGSISASFTPSSNSSFSGAEQSGPMGTQYLAPSLAPEQQPEANPNIDQAYTQSNENRSGGQT